MRLLIILVPLLVSCANTVIHRNDTPTESSVKTELALKSFLWGFIPGTGIPPAAALCPKGKVESITLNRTTADAALTWVTLGIYVPHRATIVCGK